MPGVLTPNLMTQCTAQPAALEIPDTDYGEKHIRALDGTTASYLTFTGLSDNKNETWKITYKVLPDSLYDQVLAFIDARKGGYELFYIDLPDGRTDVKVKMTPKSLRHGFDTAVTRHIEFTVYRVR